jgi:hypothetical protein
MSRESTYKIWAPPEELWTPWAKPVLFACRNALPPPPADLDGRVDVSWAPAAGDNVMLVIDLPGHQGVLMGLALAHHGYRPVPLYNAVPNSQPYLETEDGLREVVTLVDVKPIMAALWHGAPRLEAVSLPPTAPPAFLLDADRRGGGRKPLAGCFDNRSVSFTTDFPSANFLLAHCFRRVLLVQTGGDQPQADLAHTLRWWQEAGIAIELKRLDTPALPTPVAVGRPSWFGGLWYRVWTLLGLTRNELGGFGGLIGESGGG